MLTEAPLFSGSRSLRTDEAMTPGRSCKVKRDSARNVPVAWSICVLPVTPGNCLSFLDGLHQPLTDGLVLVVRNAIFRVGGVGISHCPDVVCLIAGPRRDFAPVLAERGQGVLVGFGSLELLVGVGQGGLLDLLRRGPHGR